MRGAMRQLISFSQPQRRIGGSKGRESGSRRVVINTGSRLRRVESGAVADWWGKLVSSSEVSSLDESKFQMRMRSPAIIVRPPSCHFSTAAVLFVNLIVASPDQKPLLLGVTRDR